MMNTIKEYMNLIYHNYDKMMYHLPIGSGANIEILKIILEEIEKGDIYVLVLTSNKSMCDALFQTFSSILNKDLIKESKEMCYTNNKRSVVLFRTIYNIEEELWDDLDNIILYDVHLKRNNNKVLNLIDNINKVDKKILINCYNGDQVNNVILRRFGKDNFYVNNSYRGFTSHEDLYDEINKIKMDIRKRKVEKLILTI
jgi:hypothetical protein